MGLLFWCLGHQAPMYAQTAVEEPVLAEPPVEEVYDESAEMTHDDEVFDYTPPPVKPVAMRQAPEQTWSDATRKLNYSDDVPEPPKPERPSKNINPVDWNMNTAFWGKLLQGLAVILALAAIIYWAFKLIQAPRNRKVAKDGVVITTENIEAYIHETDLERFIREALNAGNFPLAIRMYYLQIIKTLSEKGAIKWSKEKTNRDYLREMRDHRLGKQFRDVTRTYEQIWYGNKPLDMTSFALIEPDFLLMTNG